MQKTSEETDLIRDTDMHTRWKAPTALRGAGEGPCPVSSGEAGTVPGRGPEPLLGESGESGGFWREDAA